MWKIGEVHETTGANVAQKKLQAEFSSQIFALTFRANFLLVDKLQTEEAMSGNMLEKCHLGVS